MARLKGMTGPYIDGEANGQAKQGIAHLYARDARKDSQDTASPFPSDTTQPLSLDSVNV